MCLSNIFLLAKVLTLQLTVCGGIVSKELQDKCYQLTSQGWREVGRLSAPRWGRWTGQLTAAGEKLIITGGKLTAPADKESKHTAAVEYWQPPYSWSDPQPQPLPHKFYGHCTVVANDGSAGSDGQENIYLFGGKSCFRVRNDIGGINEGWTKCNKGKKMEERKEHTCAVLNNKVYIMGGKTENSELNSTEIYDPVAETFKCGPKLPAPLVLGHAFVYKGELFILYPTGKLYTLENTSNSWKFYVDLETGDLRSTDTAIVLKDSVLNC